ncbi:CD276 antigen homolog [Clarias gariepinus]|uniref:CD276 antigen homolog n=1 Tax=Clarias gariepinus TaxID=13013 RepID=UPI00234DE1B9|nr:CD276 antigen homolog [Clarias gariepinus]XP_053340682.1 CD276 antigen homolog [Clarias gariepinus]
MTNFSYICIVLISICMDLLSAGPEISVSGPVGSTAVLPCDLTSGDTDILYIRWNTESEIVFERLGEKTFQGEGYEDRVDVPMENLHKRDCSLFLHDLRLTDAGVYTSYETTKFTRLSLQNQVKLSVQGEVSALIETNSSISSASTVMKSPHPLVLSLVSCLLVQLFCGET